MELFKSRSATKKVTEAILAAVQSHGFDGIVLELWSQFGGQMRPQLTELVRSIAGEVRHAGKTAVLVIPPATSGGMFSAEDFAALADAVDFFSLMTYDYSSPQRPGPNSPIR